MSSVKSLLNNVKSTPTLNITGKDKFEVHSLTSHKHLYFYLWSIKSFLLSNNLNPSVVVHDDGTLTKEDIKKLNWHLAGVIIVTKKQADRQVLPLLKNHPSCYKYRSEQKFAKKVFDILLLANSQKIMILDSDVLFFKKPTEIINWAENRVCEMRYNHDPFDTERNIHTRLKKDLEVEYPIGYNSGLQCLSKEILDVDFLEDYLSFCYKQENLDWWVIEQRSMALLTYRYNSRMCSSLPRKRYLFQNKKNVFYKNRNINPFPKGLVAKHYSRYARNLFVTEGIPKLMKKLS